MEKTNTHYRSGVKRLLAFLLCAVCVFGMIPTQAFAFSPGQKASSWLGDQYVGSDGQHTKKIEIDGQMVEFRASAAVPRLYRIKFGRDIYKDLRSLEKSVGDNDEESSSLDLFSLEMFENIAYIMAKHAHPDQVPDTPDEWLENFNTFSIYQILPQLIELWGLNVQTEVEARKNLAKVSG